MAEQNLAEAIAANIGDAGLAELVAPGSLKSLEGNTLVELEQHGDTISIYENGDSVADISTDDADFNDRLMAVVATALNF